MHQNKRTVLFIDDDSMIIRGLRRSALESADRWNMYFARSGQEALQLLGQIPVDVLVTDMRMPGMDGIQLLQLVSQHYPGVIRFVLSGNSEFSSMLQSTRLAHQFLAKPCDFDKLSTTIERACRMRDLLNDPKLIRLTTGAIQLPSMPSLYNRLLTELQSEDASPKQVGDIIAQDVSMTAKILQLVNSAFFSLPGNISSPQRAASILGINTIKALVLGVHVFSDLQLPSNRYVSIDALWKHSLVVGQLTRKIAQQAGLDARAQEDSQVIGLLHDIGKLLELRIPDLFQRSKMVHGFVTLDTEWQILGTTHAQIGAYLLGIWGLPEHIVEAVSYHHAALPAEDGFTLITALQIANGLHYLERIHKPGEYALALDMPYLEQIGVMGELDDWTKSCREMNGVSLQS